LIGAADFNADGKPDYCVLRALIEPVVFQVSQAVEKSPDNATGVVADDR
jgi:hypothetical protein